MNRLMLSRMPTAFLLLASGSAYAAYPCVASSDELQTALTSAKAKPSPYEIHIVASASVYQLGPGNDFVYTPNDTKIIGGYAPGCGSRVEDASNTTIDFGGYSIGLFPDDDGSTLRLEIDSVTFRHGAGWSARRGYVGDFSDSTGYIIMHDVRFTNWVNDGIIEPVSIYVVKGTMQLVDVQFDHIFQNTGDPCAVAVYSDNDTTFTGNFITADLPNGKDFCFYASNEGGTFNVRVDNSIIWGSDNYGPDVATIRGVDANYHNHPLNVSTHNDISHAFIGYGNAAAPVAQISADPHWKNPAAGDYTLADIASPAVNSGDSSGLGAPYYDINHAVRIVGSHPDRGAHESPFDDSSVLTVKNTADSGVDSLRAAVDNANLYGGTHTIQFALPACPSVIYLSSPLNVTSAIFVDGYTQPGSYPNDSDLAFDASLCVLIKPATSAVAAFKVPTNASGGANGSLVLQGLGIGGFGQDVDLLGGHDHVVAGNQFGGTANGVDLGLSSLSDITVGVDADSFLIGGFGPANRNVIGASQGALGNGINVQSGIVSDPDHCQIVNNWIGLSPDGQNALPNSFGINHSGSGCSIFGNHIAGNAIGQLWINGGNGNVVQQNTIGYNIWATGLPNSDFGIRIDGNNNVVGGSATGVSPGPLLANIIGEITGAGVEVTSGTGNSIRGNLISYNGPNHDGAGMDLDLNGDGPTANGAALPGGPDNFLHFPVIDKLLYLDYPPVGNPNSPGSITGHLDAAPGTYKIDVYYSYICSAATGRGHADNYLRDFVVTIPAGGNKATFTIPILLPGDVGFDGFSLTATSVVDGTSELGNCFAVSSGVNDAIFKSGFGVGAEY